MSKKNDAEIVLLEVLKAVKKLESQGFEQDYISYFLFKFSGSHLKEILSEEKFNELSNEVKNE